MRAIVRSAVAPRLRQCGRQRRTPLLLAVQLLLARDVDALSNRSQTPDVAVRLVLSARHIELVDAVREQTRALTQRLLEEQQALGGLCARSRSVLRALCFAPDLPSPALNSLHSTSTSSENSDAP